MVRVALKNQKRTEKINGGAQPSVTKPETES